MLAIATLWFNIRRNTLPSCSSFLLFVREKRGKKEVRDLHRKEVRDLHRKEVRDLHRMGS